MRDVGTRTTLSGRLEPCEKLVVGNLDLARAAAAAWFIPNSDRDDVEQEAALAIIEAARSYRPATGTSFRSFASHVIRKRLIDRVKYEQRGRRRGNHHTVSLDAPVETSDGESGTFHDVVAGAFDLEGVVSGRERLRTVMRAAEAMSPLERRALRVIVNGDPYRGDKSIDNGVQRVRKKLRQAA